MARLSLTVTVHRPFWLTPAMWLTVQAFGIASRFGRPVTTADVKRISGWFVRRMVFSTRCDPV